MSVTVQVACKWFNLGPGHWRLLPFDAIAEILTTDKGEFVASVDGKPVGKPCRTMPQAHRIILRKLKIGGKPGEARIA